MQKRCRFFETPAEFRAWLSANHATDKELVVEFLKTATGRRSLTWPESVREALCFGWIDGVRKRVDEERYTIRFTPRRKGSRWSAINIRLIAELEAAGLMMEAGRTAFEARPHKTGPKAAGYTYERREADLDARRVREFKKHKAAWQFFDAQPAGYRRLMTWWVMSAKQDETRDRRLARLVKASGEAKRL